VGEHNVSGWETKDHHRIVKKYKTYSKYTKRKPIKSNTIRWRSSSQLTKSNYWRYNIYVYKIYSYYLKRLYYWKNGTTTHVVIVLLVFIFFSCGVQTIYLMSVIYYSLIGVICYIIFVCQWRQYETIILAGGRLKRLKSLKMIYCERFFRFLYILWSLRRVYGYVRAFGNTNIF